MVPEGVWAGVLIVDELVRGIEVEDCSFPLDGEAVDFEFVFDFASGSHVDWFGRDDFELEDGWGELFEVVGVCEKWKHGVDWLWKDLEGGEFPYSSMCWVCVGGDVDALWCHGECSWRIGFGDRVMVLGVEDS